MLWDAPWDVPWDVTDPFSYSSGERKPEKQASKRVLMPKPHNQLTDQAVDFWLARGAVLVIVGLQIAIVNDLTIGPRWLAPALEFALLIPLSIATAWTQRRARKASTKEQMTLVWRDRLMVRRLAISLTAVVTLMNFGALARLIEAILAGHAGSGRTLLLDAINIWATNVIIFALWFWALDRGGPAEHSDQNAETISCSRSNKPVNRRAFRTGRRDLSTTCFWRLRTQRHSHRPIRFLSPSGPSF